MVSALDQLSSAKTYKIACDRGRLLTKDGYLASTAHSSLEDAEAAQFAILYYDESDDETDNGSYYLYSVADQKFVTNNGALADVPTNGVEDAIKMDPETGLLLQTRPAFGGNLMATIVCPGKRPQMATVRPKVFPSPVPDLKRPWQLITESCTAGPRAFEWLEKIASAEDSDIGEADILVAVGQGIGSAENIALAEKLARKLHGSLASSRPLVDNGIMPYPRQVGQTGKTVSPRLYLALGISGAIQHMAGVAARKLVAVNTDPDAPICGYADIVIPCDCGTFLRAVLDLLA